MRIINVRLGIFQEIAKSGVKCEKFLDQYKGPVVRINSLTETRLVLKYPDIRSLGLEHVGDYYGQKRQKTQ